MKQKKSFLFTWYHREEFQVLFILFGLILFFARSLWVIGTLISLVVGIIIFLYILRIIEVFCEKRHIAIWIIKKYQNLKSALHGHSVVRSRIAMALLSAWVLGVLFLHRINLAQLNIADRTPTDIYWILFLGWYFIICTVIALYLMWLWNTWSQNEVRHILFFDGLAASLFFYHGLSKKHRIVTYIATFLLGGLPSYFAIRLSPNTNHGYQIACGLIIPLIGLVLGGALYAMHHLKNLSLEEINIDNHSYN